MKEKISYMIRPAAESDVPQLAGLTRRLAEYENLLDSYTATEELYRIHGFGKEAIFRALLVENRDEHGPDHLGMALYYFTFSTFTGKPTLYLEDIFILEEYRGKGIGTRLLVELAKIARERDCGRMEWSVLDWNEPSIQFYLSLGARPMDEWTVYRLTVPEIEKLAKRET
jgi:ribosomal protein S18 acetylase RimI-like enzyme